MTPKPPGAPLVVEDLPSGPVLVIAPHPDDEVIGPGGAVIKHARQGDPVSVVVVFDGRHGDPEGRFSHEDYASRRQAESREAVRRFFGSEDLVFHGFADGLTEGNLDAVYPGLPEDPEAKLRVLLDGLATHLRGHLERVRPRTVYYPWSGELHGDHWACGVALEALLRNEAELFEGVTVLGYEVWSTMVPELLVDVGDVIDDKIAAMRVYATQTAYLDYPALVSCLNRHRGALMPFSPSPPERRFAEAFRGRLEPGVAS